MGSAEHRRTAEDRRTAWADLPAGLHRAVENVLGAPVTSAVSQHNGFSPGSADRVRTGNGRRAFVKAVHRDRNPGAFDLHTREIRVMTALPSSVNAPALLHAYSADGWAALVLADIHGRHPGEARDGADIVPVLDALATVSLVPASDLGDLADLPRAADEFAGDAAGWSRLQNEGAIGELPGWVRGSFDRLRTAAENVAAAVEGDSLLHLDCRADNVQIDRAGTAWIIDWPWASIGAPWVDGVTYLLDARLRGESVDADALLREHPLFDGVTAEEIDAVLAAATGGFFAKARLSPPANMPTLRAFQRSEALAGAAWLRQRWGR